MWLLAAFGFRLSYCKLEVMGFRSICIGAQTTIGGLGYTLHAIIE